MDNFGGVEEADIPDDPKPGIKARLKAAYAKLPTIYFAFPWTSWEGIQNRLYNFPIPGGRRQEWVAMANERIYKEVWLFLLL